MLKYSVFDNNLTEFGFLRGNTNETTVLSQWKLEVVSLEKQSVWNAQVNGFPHE